MSIHANHFSDTVDRISSWFLSLHISWSVLITPAMFTRQLAQRSARAAARTYATVSEASGVKVAGIDNGQPTTSISVVVKAGSRFESRPGVAHALKNFAFKVSRGDWLRRNFRGADLGWDAGMSLGGRRLLSEGSWREDVLNEEERRR